MTTSRSSRRQKHYPYERGLGREQRRAAARERLHRYLDQVAAALRGHGFEVIRTHLGQGGDLEAVLSVTPAEPARRDLPPVLELSWAEDTGWAVSHHLISNTATPWRYLHTELVPDPARVARFLALVAEDSNDDAEVGMLYPAQFRFRGQPLQPVLDELARHTAAGEHTPSAPHPSARPSAPSCADGAGSSGRGG